MLYFRRKTFETDWYVGEIHMAVVSLNIDRRLTC